MRWYRKWLARAGLYFPEPGREEAFREHFVERRVNLMQAFMLGGAILFVAEFRRHSMRRRDPD